MNMNFAYPARVQHDSDGYTVAFRDVPGAITCGDSREQALEEAGDALALIIEDLLEDGEPLPVPSNPRRGEQLVAVPADVCARALLRLIRDVEDLSKAAAANLIGVTRQSYGQVEARGRNLTLKTFGEMTSRLGYDVILEVRAKSRRAISRNIDVPTSAASARKATARKNKPGNTGKRSGR